jgi:hypothetical protein
MWFPSGLERHEGALSGFLKLQCDRWDCTGRARKLRAAGAARMAPIGIVSMHYDTNNLRLSIRVASFCGETSHAFLPDRVYGRDRLRLDQARQVAKVHCRDW